MRVVAFDVGARRTGVAISDASATLARPWKTLPGADPALAIALVQQLLAEEDGVSAVVVGLPRRLDGSPTHLTAQALAFAKAVRSACAIPVVLQDERLSSVEAEQRLAVRDKDWRRRKAKLDPASAAVVLQDFLDHRPPEGVLADGAGGTG